MIKVMMNSSIDELTYKRWLFPGGEVGVKFDNLEYADSNHYVVISVTNQKVTPEAQLVIINLIDALNQKYYKNISLYMHYLPYARQDRVCSDGESFALKIFLNMLNSVKFDCLYTFDVHNFDAVLNLTAKMNYKYHDFNCGYFLITLRDNGYLDSDTTIVLPDKGAAKKLNIIKDVHKGKIIVADKLRGTIGQVFHTIPENPSGKVLVLDDICDGGATFLSLAGLLTNAERVTLAVSHGIFSKGLVELLDHYDDIVCYNNMSGIEPLIGHYSNFKVLN